MSGRGRALLWIPVVPLAIWAIVRMSGFTVGHPFVQLMAFTPYVAAGALLLLGPLLGARAWAPATVTALSLAILAVCVLPRALGATNEYRPGPRLTVMAMNMRVGQADAAQIVGLVRDHRVDVLAVQELTPQGEQALA